MQKEKQRDTRRIRKKRTVVNRTQTRFRRATGIARACVARECLLGKKVWGWEHLGHCLPGKWGAPLAPEAQWWVSDRGTGRALAQKYLPCPHQGSVPASPGEASPLGLEGDGDLCREGVEALGGLETSPRAECVQGQHEGRD